MALVTDINGECSAGTTPHTVWYPQIEASPNFVNMALNTGLGEAYPNANTELKAPEVVSALLSVCGYLSGGPTGTAGFVSLGAAGAADC